MTRLAELIQLAHETPPAVESFFLPMLAQANIRQATKEFQQLLEAARDSGVTRPAVVETLLQCCLFDGYPAALEGMQRLAALWPQPGRLLEEYSAEQLTEWRKRGLRLVRRIYAGQTNKLIANINELSPDLANWFLVEGYGRVLSRPGLSAEVRELITVAILLWKGYPRQLLSHLLGALRVGVAIALLEQVVRLCDVQSESVREQALEWCRRYETEAAGADLTGEAS